MCVDSPNISREKFAKSLFSASSEKHASEHTSAGAIEKVSEDADEQHDDDDDRDYSEGDHGDTLEGLPKERKHSTRIQHREPRKNRRDRHRLVGKARLETGITFLLAPGLAEDCQIEKVCARDHQENNLPVERRTRDVLPGLADEEEHPGDEIGAEAQHAPWQQTMDFRKGSLFYDPEYPQVHGQQHTEREAETQEVHRLGRRPCPRA